MLKIALESENASKYSLPINNIFGMIFHDFKDSNGLTNVVMNIATLGAIYIFLNTVRTKSTAVRKVSVATTEKNVVTTNRRAKVRRRNIKDLIKYMSFSLIATAITNKLIVLLFSLFLYPDPIV